MRLVRFAAYLCVVLLGSMAAAAEDDAAAAHDDVYLAGFAAAIVQRDFGLEVERVEVSGGVARIVIDDLEEHHAERIADAVARIKGIDRVYVFETGDESKALDSAYSNDEEDDEVDNGVELLPRDELFEPLIADPREPHFSAIYQWYLDDPELTHVGAANFGETFALLGGPIWGGRWEIGLLGGVFSIFDLDAPSYDLVNSDFWVGPTLSLRKSWFSTQMRLYHQSSHLGDEYLLRTSTERENLSYEGVDLLMSVDPFSWARLYAGGGAIVHSDPHLDPLIAQGGGELESPWALFDAIRPIAAFDYKARQEQDWRDEFSGSAGVQLENPRVSKLRVQILANWFKGNSPNGQFFERRIETIGAGIHLRF